MLRLSDGRNFGRTLTGLCLIAAPVLLLIAAIVSPDVDDDNKAKELANIAAHKGSYLTGNLLWLLAAIVLIGASVGIIHLFRGRKVGLGQVAGSLMIMAGAVSFGWYAFAIVEYEMVNHSGIDRAAMANFLDKAGDSTGTIIPFIVLFLLGVVVGLVLLGVAAWRRRMVPAWSAALIAVAGVVAFFGESKGVEIMDFVILIAGLGPLGLATLRMSDEEWDSPREPAAPAVPVEPAAAAAPAT
jgi:Domain of unknown function (DUF4386)